MVDTTNGNDVINGTSSPDTIDGLAGNDRLSGGAGNDTISGGEGNDILNGGSDADNIDGGLGNDSLWGGTGNDKLLGGEGNDILGGDAGHDLLDGGLGNDKLWGNDGNDKLLGGDGNDTLGGGSGSDILKGGVGNDKLYGNEGNDQLIGGEGNDQLHGENGNDIVRGNQGNDKITGGIGNDILEGNRGNDTLAGGEGDDTLFGGVGNDTLTGGAGADTFAMRLWKGGKNIITDFKVGEDSLSLILNRQHFVLNNDVIEEQITLRGETKGWDDSKIADRIDAKEEKIDNKLADKTDTIASKLGYQLDTDTEGDGYNDGEEKANQLVSQAINNIKITVNGNDLTLHFNDMGSKIILENVVSDLSNEFGNPEGNIQEYFNENSGAVVALLTNLPGEKITYGSSTKNKGESFEHQNLSEYEGEHSEGISVTTSEDGATRVIEAQNWNAPKEVRVEQGVSHLTNVEINNFVAVEADYSQATDDITITLNHAKRTSSDEDGGIETGSGNDTIDINAYSNSDYWRNEFKIDTNEGDDTVSLESSGKEGYKGEHTFSVVNLGAGSDTFESSDEFLSEDLVDTGSFQASANLIQNGEFSENGLLESSSWGVTSVEGWDSDHDKGIEIQARPHGGTPGNHDGDYIELDGHGSNSNTTISQQFTVSETGDYLLNFDFSGRMNTETSEFVIEISGANDFSWSQTIEPGVGWAQFRAELTELQAGDYTLSFTGAGTQDSYGALIDNVSVRQADLGDDTVESGGGDDVLIARDGHDTLTGGEGDDTFQIITDDEGWLSTTITDFANGDAIELRDGDTILTLDANSSISDQLSQSSEFSHIAVESNDDGLVFTYQNQFEDTDIV